MPEGPEVKNIALRLHQRLQGATLLRFDYIEERINKRHQKEIAGYTSLNESLPLPLSHITSHGKKIIFGFINQSSLISSLGMTGSWVYERGAYTTFILTFDTCVIYYEDPRRFGGLVYCSTPEAYRTYFADIGPCLLNDVIPFERYCSILRKKSVQKKKIAAFLLEQKHLAGIGNYLRSDILYLSRIHPFRQVHTLTHEEQTTLYQSIFQVMRESCKAGGYTLQDYIAPDGQRGTYSPLVYNREIDAEGRKVETLSDGRTIYYVPEWQV